MSITTRIVPGWLAGQPRRSPVVRPVKAELGAERCFRAAIPIRLAAGLYHP